MTIPEKAAEWAVQIANDDSHGYDQGSRWSPDYDCSSLVISAYKFAGVPLTCTYTGNMRSNMLDNGFIDATSKVNLASGAGLEVGDVLLNVIHHTAIYVGNGKLVHASGNEWGGATGGQTGDQTGREICVTNYFLFSQGWDFVLRYARKEPAPVPVNEYVVQSGDSLWSIAERFLGNGARYFEIMALNGLSSTVIYPGQVLKIPGLDGTKTITVTIKGDTYDTLKVMADGWAKTIGETIDLIVEAL